MPVPTPHIAAAAGDFAKTVLMPGDPLRAKFIAENFLYNPVLINSVRGILGYTGYYNGKRVSVMASGMGQPSIGIYSYELFNFYDVDNIIRVGTCGSFNKDMHVRDIILAQGACTNGSYQNQYGLKGVFCPLADFDLLRRAAEQCEKAGVNYKVGNILSSDIFYDESGSGIEFAKLGVLGVEMEASALYCNAARAGKKALAICTVSDSFVYPEEETTSEERQNSFTAMMKIALELA